MRKADQLRRSAPVDAAQDAKRSLADVLVELARIKLQLRDADSVELRAQAETLWEELSRRAPPKPRGFVRTPLDAARENADVLQFSVPPSHRAGPVGRLVTTGKKLALAALGPLASQALGPQNAFNKAALELAEALIARKPLTPAEVRSRLVPLSPSTSAAWAASEPVIALALERQRKWNDGFMSLMERAAAGSAPRVEEANAVVARLADLCDPVAKLPPGRIVRLTAPFWREVFRRQTAFNTELMLLCADLLNGRPPVVAPREADYAAWRERHDTADVEDARSRLATLRRRPKISIVVPAWETPAAILEACIESVRAQLYENWELCIADDGSKSRRVERIARRYAKRDPRIRFTRLEKNQGIAGATNEAIRMSTGEWVAFLDHDDQLAPHALAEMAVRIDREPELDWLYSDEDRLTPEGERFGPFFKPDFSPELLRSVNYICHFVVVRGELARELLIRKGFEGSQDHDFLLRLWDRSEKVAHVPKILYHWRSSDLSLSHDDRKLRAASRAGVRAIEDHLLRRGERAQVTELAPTHYRVRHPVRGEPLVSIIVPFKDRVELLERLVPSLLQRTRYQNFELLLVSNNSKDPATFAFLDALTDPRVRRLTWDQPFNYPAINNYAVGHSSGELLLFLNNDIEAADPLWLDELIGQAQRPEVGAVGPKLCFPDGSVQHAGVVVGLSGYAGHPFWRFPDTQVGTPFGHADWNRNYLAVTSACVMLRREVFAELGGYDERFALCGSDVDLGIRLVVSGKRVVYTAGTWLYHHESASRRNDTIPEVDYWQSIIAYRRWLEQGDPFYNPNLTLASTDCALRIDEPSAIELAAQAVQHFREPKAR
ncbi:MAG: glycosyltransferase family 2 protein [Myxococcaceae bacterium]